MGWGSGMGYPGPGKSLPNIQGQKKHRIPDLIPNTAEKYKRISMSEPEKLYFMDVKSRVGLLIDCYRQIG
jgi:hypothetical protein